MAALRTERLSADIRDRAEGRVERLLPAPARDPRQHRAALEHDPEKACPGLDPGREPVSRLREAFAQSIILARCFAGRRQVGKDHAQLRNFSP